MKKLMILGLCGLFLTSCNPTTLQEVNRSLDELNRTIENPAAVAAENYVPENPSWVYKHFFLNERERQQACATGYQSANAGYNQNIPGFARFNSASGGGIEFRDARKVIANVCRRAALDGKVKPDSVPELGVDIASTKGENVTLAFYDENGQEITRISRRVSIRAVGGGSDYAGYGVNIENFSLAQKRAIASAQSFGLITNFGRGLETFRVTPDRLR